MLNFAVVEPSFNSRHQLALGRGNSTAPHCRRIRGRARLPAPCRDTIGARPSAPGRPRRSPACRRLSGGLSQARRERNCRPSTSRNVASAPKSWRRRSSCRPARARPCRQRHVFLKCLIRRRAPRQKDERIGEILRAVVGVVVLNFVIVPDREARDGLMQRPQVRVGPVLRIAVAIGAQVGRFDSRRCARAPSPAIYRNIRRCSRRETARGRGSRPPDGDRPRNTRVRNWRRRRRRSAAGRAARRAVARCADGRSGSPRRRR